MRSVRHFFQRWNQVRLNLKVPAGIDHDPPVGGTHRPGLRSSQAWRSLYVAALFETDEERMVQRIAEAKKALVSRAREIFQTTGDHLQEQSAIEETLQALHALELCMVHREARISGTNEHDFAYSPVSGELA